MSTEDTRPPTVPADELDDVIARASELHEAARAREERVTIEEIEAVAEELGIDPSYVEQAVRSLEVDREAEARAAARQRSRRRIVWTVGGGVAVVIGLVASAQAMRGAHSLSAADQLVDLTGQALDEVLDRQADLVPQLVALAGADADAVRDLASEVRAADDLDDAMDASRRLHEELAETLGALPPPSNAYVAQQRLELHHEVVGTWSRIELAARRHREAEAARDEVASTGPARLAHTLGLAD
jgi:hypothetical protein